MIGPRLFTSRSKCWQKRPRKSAQTGFVFLALAATSLIWAPSSTAHMWWDVPTNCGVVHGPYEYNNYSQTSNVSSNGGYLRTNAHNKVNPEHCINRHRHHVWWWDSGAGSWRLSNTWSYRWTYGDWVYNPETWYWTNMDWTVSSGYWWTSTSDSYMNSNKFAGNVGLGGHWDDESASSADCWYYKGGSSWTKNC